MKKRFLILPTLALAISPLHADNNSGQMEVTKNMTDKIHAMPLTERDYTAMCERILHDTKAKRKMCELLAQDPEAMAFLRAQKK